MKVRFILPVTIRKRFSLLQTIEDIHFDHVRMYVAPHRIFLIIFTSDLVISYTNKDRPSTVLVPIMTLK